MITWKPSRMSCDGDVEAVVKLKNPIEPEFPLRICINIYGLKPDAVIVSAFAKKWRAHAQLDVGSKMELFRFTHEGTCDEAKHLVVEGLRKMFGLLNEGIAEVAPEPVLTAEETQLLEAGVRFPAYNDRPSKGRLAPVWMVMHHEHYMHARRLEVLRFVETEPIDGGRQMRVTGAGKRELQRLGLAKFDEEGHLIEG